jgi:tyrosine decarboxylase/aspartate 1-decarboxylase
VLEKRSLELLPAALGQLEEGFAGLPAFEAEIAGDERMGAVLSEVAVRLHDNFPYFHPLYAGQMLKPPHPVAKAAYALATWINPNNHALDGGRASSAMEKEAVALIATMFGWHTHLGHLTSSGTLANLEALWVAGKLHPGKTILASEQAHYTHERISGVLQLPFEKVAADERGRMDVSALEARLAQGDVGCVVVTLGTTGLGAVDPLKAILGLREKHGFRVHIDGAYGGYFGLANNLGPEAMEAFSHVSKVDSIVIDPHKHGLQPYGCGCVLFDDPEVGALYKHDSPYTYFSSNEMHLGEISLECSRAGASAVALWATMRLLPLWMGGEFAAGLEASRRAAVGLATLLSEDDRWRVICEPELDIVVWAPRHRPELARAIFEEAARMDLHLALIQVGGQLCLRSVLMKPEHESWLTELTRRLSRAYILAEARTL